MKKINFKNHLIILIFIPVIWCCNPTQGTVKTKNGKEVSSKYKLSCSPPTKTYAKGLEAKLDASIDSLSSLPKTNFEASIETTVVKLTQYTSEGLDRDLFYFRMCEMLNNNRDLSKESRKQLFDKVLAKYDDEVKKKNQH